MGKIRGPQSQDLPTSRDQGGFSEALLTFHLSHQGGVGIVWLQMRLKRKEETYCTGLEARTFSCGCWETTFPPLLPMKAHGKVVWLAFVSV